MLYCTGFRGSRHYAPKVLDEEEDDFFITVLFQLYYNYKMTIIIILLLDDHYYYIIISILCWCFCVVYNILQKKCTYTLWSLEYLRLSVIGIDGCTVGMYHSPLSTFTCNKHIKEIDCELLIKGTFLHFAFHLLCPR